MGRMDGKVALITGAARAGEISRGQPSPGGGRFWPSIARDMRVIP